MPAELPCVMFFDTTLVSSATVTTPKTLEGRIVMTNVVDIGGFACRFKKCQGRAPVKDNLAGLRVRVMQAGELYRLVENVIPSHAWTNDFRR